MARSSRARLVTPLIAGVCSLALVVGIVPPATATTAAELSGLDTALTLPPTCIEAPLGAEDAPLPDVTATPSVTPSPAPSSDAPAEPTLNPTAASGAPDPVASPVGDTVSTEPRDLELPTDAAATDVPSTAPTDVPNDTETGAGDASPSDVEPDQASPSATAPSEEPLSEVDAPTTPQCAATVTGLVVTPSDRSVDLRWSTGDALTARFVVAVREAGVLVNVQSLAGDADQLHLAGYHNGLPLDIAVFTLNAAGEALPADWHTVTPTAGAGGLVGGLIVNFAPGVAVADGSSDIPGEEAVTEVDLQRADNVGRDLTTVAFSEATDAETAQRIARELAQSPEVVWAEPNVVLQPAASGLGGADPGQWALTDTYGIAGGTATSTLTDSAAGSGTVVAVIDTGITDHPALRSRLVPGYDFVSDPTSLASIREDGEPAVSFDGDAVDQGTYGPTGWDDNPADPGDWRNVAPVRPSTWHGTHVAGVIAADPTADAMTGVAPGARIEPVRALSWRGGLLSDVASSITWASGGTVDGAARNANPANVITMAFAVQSTCPRSLQAAIDDARSRGSVLVAAAGNADSDVSAFTPANCQGVITVGATGRDGQRASYSNWGAGVDLAAPGGSLTSDGGVISTSNAGSREPDAPATRAMEGTSVAAAHVSGLVARLLTARPGLSPDDALSALTSASALHPFAGATCDPDPSKSCGPGIAHLAQVASASCPTATCAFETSKLRFGTGTQNSVNSQGLLQQPFYKNGASWYKLTYSSYPLDMAIGVGTGGGSWHGNSTIYDTQSSSLALTGQSIDYSGFTATSTSGTTSLGYGTIVSTGTLSGTSLRIQNTYTLGQNDGYISITTQVTNNGASSMSNVHIWAGTRDDWVGGSDGPTKTKGNLVNGAFTATNSQATLAQALQITSGTEGVLFYSTTSGTNSSINSCCSFSNAYNQDPTTSQLTLTGDGSYAVMLPVGTLAAAASTTLTWYYAAGATADLAAVAQAVAAAAAPAAPSVTRGDAQASLTWTAPTSADPITDYRVRYSTDSGSTWSTAVDTASTSLSHVMSSLSNGSTYIFQVAAGTGTSPYTWGEWSQSSSPVTLGTADPPTSVSVQSGNGSATVSFTAGASDISAITNYGYSLDGGSTWLSLSPADASSPITITGLSNGTTYSNIRVRAMNTYGSSTQVSVPSVRPVGPASAANSTIAVGSSSLTANGIATTTITVQLKDATNATLTSNGANTLTLATTTGSIGTVSNPDNGTFTATFTSASTVGTATISGALNGSAMTATATISLTVGPANKATVTTQPGGAVTGVAFTTQPVVQIQDLTGNLRSDSTLSVVADIASGTGTLLGTATVAAVAGVATFTNLGITGTSGTYTLRFTPTGLNAGLTAAFTVTIPSAPAPAPSPTPAPVVVATPAGGWSSLLRPVTPIRPAPSAVPTPTPTPSPTATTLRPVGAATPTATPTALPTLAPVPDPIVVEGERIVPVTIAPNATRTGVELIGSTFSAVITTTDEDGTPTSLGRDGAVMAAVGGLVDVTIIGYQPQTPVAVYLMPSTTTRSLSTRALTEPLLLGEAYVNPDGSMSTIFDLPHDLVTGVYDLQLNGVTPDNEIRSLTLAIRVSRPSSDPRTVRRGAFFTTHQAAFTHDGRAKVATLGRAVPTSAAAVTVTVTAVSVGLDTASANGALAKQRARALVASLRAQPGLANARFVVTTATSDNGRTGSTMVHSRSGKPLTTVSVTYTPSGSA